MGEGGRVVHRSKVLSLCLGGPRFKSRCGCQAASHLYLLKQDFAGYSDEGMDLLKWDKALNSRDDDLSMTYVENSS